MDLRKLERDWAEDPCLRYCAHERVEDLADHLLKAHKYLMSPDGGPLAYLYQAQVRRVRELTKELNDERERKTSGR
jgi:hypothetical protein